MIAIILTALVLYLVLVSLGVIALLDEAFNDPNWMDIKDKEEKK